MRKTALVLLMTLVFSALAFAGDTYLPDKIEKWANGTYPDGKSTKTWVVYQMQADNGTTYSFARHKENKPQMQAGESVKYLVKKNDITVVDMKGKKREYQIVGQAAGQSAVPAQ